ncbi:MAG: hypothetical protein ACJ71Z_11995 [Aeromicrobium sp.]
MRRTPAAVSRSPASLTSPEPDGLADRRRLTANLAAVGLLVALGAGVLAWQQPWRASDSTGRDTMPADARAEVVRQFQRMSAAHSRAAFVKAVGSSGEARATGRHIWDARHVLRIEHVRYSYTRGGEAIDRADGTTSAEAKVSWRGGASDVRFRLRPRPDGFDVISASNAGRRPLPVWLAGEISVSRAAEVTVMTVDGGNREIDAAKLAGVGAAQVKRLVPTAEADLTVVVPRRVSTTAALLGRRPSQVAQVAATSTELGGRNGKPAIVLNPTVFASMDARARQIVMTHEATHALTGIVGHTVDPWVAEGFADYVALHDDRASLAVSAGQILRKVKAGGPPKVLPSAKDFNESAHGLGAAYEAAWMAFRMLGAQFGDAALRDFYTDVVAGTSVDAAAQRRFGLTVDQLTAEWRSYLTKSASTVS